MSGFWTQLRRPFTCLAPMADVTDAAFRRLFAKYSKPFGGPDVMWTEFVSAEGLLRGGFDVLKKDLEYTEAERPIVAQFFSAEPETLCRAGVLARELGFDGVDINMGCPDRAVCKQGAGAALMKNPALARRLIRATQDGAEQLPVSVKTRLGWNTIETDTWIPELLAEKPAAVIVHARTQRELSKVPAHWEEIARVVSIRNELKSSTRVVGNGDVMGLADAHRRAEETGADGIMIGRAAFGNPWLWHEGYRPTLQERLRVLVEHAKLFEEILGGVKSFAVMKKHFKAYTRGISCLPAGGDGAKELRMRLMDAQDAGEVGRVVETFLAHVAEE